MIEQRPDAPAAAGEPPAPRRGLSRGAKSLIGGLGVVALLGTGVAVAHPFGWPSKGTANLTVADVVPADAEAFVGVDLKPDITQQLEMVRFALKFPAVRQKLHVSEQGDVKQEVWDAVTKDAPCRGVSYQDDIKPWLGDHFGAAELGKGKGAIIVAEATEEQQARAAIGKLATCWHWNHPGVAYRGGYLVAATSQTVADQAVAAGTANPLSGRAEYVEDFGKVGSQGVLSAWATRQGLDDLPKATGGQKAGTRLNRLTPSGSPSIPAAQDYRSVAATLRFVDGNPELRMVMKATRQLDTSTTHTTIDALPKETTIAVGVSDGSTLVTKDWATVQQALKANHQSVAELERKAHLKLPEDLTTLFGKDLRVAVGPVTATTPSKQAPVAVLSQTDGAQFKNLLDRLQLRAKGVSITPARDGVQVAAVNKAWAQHVADPKADRLASEDGFQAAYPTAEQDQFGLYVNLGALQPLLTRGMTSAEKANMAPLDGFGLSSHIEDANYAVVVVRLTAK